MQWKTKKAQLTINIFFKYNNVPKGMGKKEQIHCHLRIGYLETVTVNKLVMAIIECVYR
jgi:hypothetical protein